MAKEQVRLSNPIGPVKIYMSQYFVRMELDNAQEHTHRFLVALKTARTLAISVGSWPTCFLCGISLPPSKLHFLSHTLDTPTSFFFPICEETKNLTNKITEQHLKEVSETEWDVPALSCS